MAFEIYKSGQGRYVRVGTIIGAVLVNFVLCYYTWLKLDQYLPGVKAGVPETETTLALAKLYLEYGIPFVLFAVMTAVEAYFLNKPVVVDFFIATESEMKKVSWSSRAELFGSTMVVIATVFMMAVMIWIVDVVYNLFLHKVLGLW